MPALPEGGYLKDQRFQMLDSYAGRADQNPHTHIRLVGALDFAPTISISETP
jgi:hypothetical protein